MHVLIIAHLGLYVTLFPEDEAGLISLSVLVRFRPPYDLNRQVRLISLFTHQVF